MTTAPEAGRCRSCGANILWIKACPSGRPVPLDPEPITGDTERVAGVPSVRGYTAEGQVRSIYPRPEGPVVVYITHFATCPQGSAWHTRTKR